ncbi:MAG: TrpR-like protein, YerC/YecD [Clostridia bacterium]|nr:TrpR-like protein, YerC/YecD [Clostridia bacterium]
MKKRLQDENIDFLYNAILSLKNVEECYDFFEDLCTISEIKAMAQRLLVAKLLRENKLYVDIIAETGVSTATISRINRCLHYGSDGYAVVLERLCGEEDGEKDGEEKK